MRAFTHRSDLDGRTCAALLHYFLPGTEIIPIDYGDKFPWETIQDGEEVYMCDYSLPIQDMITLNGKCHLVWIDHHETSYQARLNSGMVFQGIQVGKSPYAACELLWYFFRGHGSREFDPSFTDVPWALKLLSLWDVWEHENSQVVPFQFGFRIEDLSPESAIWPKVWESKPSWIDEVCQLGHKLKKNQDDANAATARDFTFETTFEGHKALAVNRFRGGSEFFRSVARDDVDIFLAFCWLPSSKWKVSIYSNKKEINVADISKKYGGGGHANAAGFEVCELPFKPFLKEGWRS